MSASAKTLDEVEDPILDHVLWKKRFLWDTSDPSIQNKVYSFYVNEMMNQVSTTSPIRLRQAVGGILAGIVHDESFYISTGFCVLFTIFYF